MTFSRSTLQGLAFGLAGFLRLTSPDHLPAQTADPLGSSALTMLTIRPQLGIQTMWFLGNAPVRQEMSSNDPDQPVGGGITGTNDAVHLAVEIIPSLESPLRFPVSFDAFFLKGKTTFVTTRRPERVRRLLLEHTAQIYSFGAGVTASFFRTPSLYFSLEAKLNYLPPNDLYVRSYYGDNNETIKEFHQVPDSVAKFRLGAFGKIGTQVQFIEPFMLDFNIGAGFVNLLGRDSDPRTTRDLMIIDNQLRSLEKIVPYFGVGFGIVWKL